MNDPKTDGAPPAATVDSKLAETIVSQQQAAQASALEELKAIQKVAEQINAETGRTKMYHVFKSRIPSCQFVTRKGRYVQFVAGLLFTNEPMLIAEIAYEITNGHPHIWQDPNYAYVDEIPEVKAASERERLKEEVRAEVMREMGFTPGGDKKLGGIQTTHNIAQAAVAGGVNVSPGQPLRVNRPSA